MIPFLQTHLPDISHLDSARIRSERQLHAMLGQSCVGFQLARQVDRRESGFIGVVPPKNIVRGGRVGLTYGHEENRMCGKRGRQQAERHEES
jgi:hypothetical protein